MRSSQPTRLPRPALLASVLFLAFVALALVASAGSASAKSGFLGDFNALYGTAGTPLDSCSLCHTSVPAVNGYGADWTNNSKNFSAIESRDSDGDGWTNIQEIQALTMPGNAASVPSSPTTTTQPPTSTTLPPTTTTTPPTSTTLPPPGTGPLDLRIKDFDVPGSVNVTSGSVSREIKVKAEVDNANDGANVTAQIQLWANGSLAQTISQTREAEDDGEVEYEVKFDFTFTTAHVPRVDWWAIIVVDGQASSPGTGVTTVTGPAPPTTTTRPPTGTTLPPVTSTTRPPVTSTTRPPGGLDGAAIYAAACAGCHGADGSGGFGGPVAGTSMSLGEVISITADGAGGMPGFSDQFSAAEIEAVSAYVLTLGSGGPPPPTTTTTLPPGTPPGSGAALYRQHCAGCHGANADGGAGGPLVGTGLSFAQQVSVTAHGRGTMPGFSSVLSSSEIDSIIRYVASLGGPGTATPTTVPPDEESGASIYGRLCAACHGANGSGGSGGPIVDTAFTGSSLAGVINNGLGTMPGFGAQLNAGQVSRLVAYVEGFAGSSDAKGPTAGVIGEDGQIDPAAGFTGHQSEAGGSAGEGSAAALGVDPTSNSPLPVGNPIGWTLAFAIAAFLVALGSALTGAMPKEADESTFA